MEMIIPGECLGRRDNTTNVFVSIIPLQYGHSVCLKGIFWYLTLVIAVGKPLNLVRDNKALLNFGILCI